MEVKLRIGDWVMIDATPEALGVVTDADLFQVEPVYTVVNPDTWARGTVAQSRLTKVANPHEKALEEVVRAARVVCEMLFDDNLLPRTRKQLAAALAELDKDAAP